MPEFTDFQVQQPLPAKTSWAALAPLVTLAFPPPLTTMKRCPSPHTLPTQPVSLTPAELTFRMSAVGYGEYAHYGMTWLLAGKSLGTSELRDLQRLTKARLSIAHRAYRIVPGTSAGGLPTVSLRPRTIYPLIESSELVSISFVMGCALAEVCAPLALNHRPIGLAGGMLWHLFHVSLLEATKLCSNVIKVQMSTKQKVDFLAIDSALGTVHIIEAKGMGGKFDGSRVGEGLGQCAAVEGIEVMGGPLEPVASLNVCASYEHAGSVRTAIFQLMPPVAVLSPQAGISKPLSAQAPVTEALEILIGTKLMGMFLMLQAAGVRQEDGEWISFAIEPPDDDDDDDELSVAVSLQLWRRLKIFWSDSELSMKIGPERFALQRELVGGPPVNEHEVRQMELQARLRGLGIVGLRYEPGTMGGKPPQGFELSALEPWLAFKTILGDS